VRDQVGVDHLRYCLDLAFASDTAAWTLEPDGRWVRSGGTRGIDYQEVLMKRLAGRGE